MLYHSVFFSRASRAPIIIFRIRCVFTPRAGVRINMYMYIYICKCVYIRGTRHVVPQGPFGRMAIAELLHLPPPPTVTLLPPPLFHSHRTRQRVQLLASDGAPSLLISLSSPLRYAEMGCIGLSAAALPCRLILSLDVLTAPPPDVGKRREVRCHLPHRGVSMGRSAPRPVRCAE